MSIRVRKLIQFAALTLIMPTSEIANADVQCTGIGPNRKCEECQWITSKNGDRFCVRNDPLAGKPKPKPSEARPLVPIYTNPWPVSPPSELRPSPAIGPAVKSIGGAPSAPATQQQPAQNDRPRYVRKLATAKNDVDIYNSPVSPRKVIAMMRGGTQGRVLEHHVHGWCKLEIPTSKVVGWVARNHLTGCP
jgi:hypothetical protein